MKMIVANIAITQTVTAAPMLAFAPVESDFSGGCSSGADVISAMPDVVVEIGDWLALLELVCTALAASKATMTGVANSSSAYVSAVEVALPIRYVTLVRPDAVQSAMPFHVN
jgi:hypothetical protein